MLTSKVMRSQSGQHIITIRILLSTWRCGDNQTIKFGQLIEHKMASVLLGKSYTKYGGKANPRHFYKNTKFRIFLDQQSEVL